MPRNDITPSSISISTNGETKNSPRSNSNVNNIIVNNSVDNDDDNDDDNDVEEETVDVKVFGFFLIFFSLAPTWNVLFIALIKSFFGNVCLFGVFTIVGNFVPVTTACVLAQSLLSIKRKRKILTETSVANSSMNWFEIINWVQLSVFVLIIGGIAPYVIFPIDWIHYLLCPAIPIVLGLMILIVVFIALPKIKTVIQANLRSKSSLRYFRLVLMFTSACSIVFQFFIFTIFAFPTITSKDVVGAYSGKNQSQNIYAKLDESPLFVEFAVPNWWYHITFSTSLGTGLIGLPIVIGGASVVETARSTGRFINRLIVVAFVGFLLLLLSALSFAGLLAQNSNRSQLVYMSPLQSLRSSFDEKYVLFIFAGLSCAEIFTFFILLILLLQLSKSIEDLRVLKNGNNWHFFLSHHQEHGGDQCAVLSAELEQRDWKVWYDNKMENLTADGMKEGVRKSAVFLLFLTKGIFSRPYVQLEISEALKYKKPILLLHELDERHGKFDFDSKTGVPDTFQPIAKKLLLNNESIGWERRDFKQEAVLNEIKKKFLKFICDQLDESNNKKSV